MQRSTNVFHSLLVFGLAIGWTAAVAAAEEEAPAKEKADPSGTWRWEYERDGRTLKNVLKLQRKGDEVTGTFRRDDREIKIEKGKIDGNELSLQFKVDLNGGEITVKFLGKVSEDDIQGKVSIASADSSREFDWEAKRSVEPADVIGTWKFKIAIGDDRVLQPTLKLSQDGEKLKGVYTSQFGQRDAKEIKLQKNQLSFLIAGENDGRSFRVRYKGKPRGDSIQGVIDYDFDGQTGSIDFEGQRVKEKKTE